MGSLELPLDRPVTLAELRAALSKAPDGALRELTASRFGFVTEAYRPLSPREVAACVVQHVYPSRAIMLRENTGESLAARAAFALLRPSGSASELCTEAVRDEEYKPLLPQMWDILS